MTDIVTTKPPPDPFVGRVQQDKLRIEFVDGSVMEGSFLTQAGMAFLHVRAGGVHGRVEGPFAPDTVSKVILLRSRDEIVEERRIRKLGEPVPGTLRQTRDGYEARLETLARMAAMTTGRRRDEIEAQFDEVADEISLAKTKRNWMLAVARWVRFSNRPPSKIDMCGGDLTSAERFHLPRPQDFDPDPKVRRARVPVPAHLLTDPRSVPNMVKALRSGGFRVKPSIFGETTFEDADLIVDFPGGKERGRFAVIGRRTAEGAMAWRFDWEGNSTKASTMRYRRSVRSDDYRKFSEIVRRGLADVHLREDAVQDASSRPSPR